MCNLLQFLFGIGAFAFACYSCYFTWKRRPIIHYMQGDEDGWFNIKDHELIHNGFTDNEIIISDGEESKCTSFITYDHQGRAIMNQYRGTFVKYWKPIPRPPCILKKHPIRDRRKYGSK